MGRFVNECHFWSDWQPISTLSKIVSYLFLYEIHCSWDCSIAAVMSKWYFTTVFSRDQISPISTLNKSYLTTVVSSNDYPEIANQVLTRISRISRLFSYNTHIYRYWSPTSSLNKSYLTSWIMMTSSNGNIFRGVTGSLLGESSPHTGQWRGALMFSFICASSKQLSKYWRRWWFETPSSSLWCHCNETHYH